MYTFFSILRSGYEKVCELVKGGYEASIWAARTRHPSVKVTPPGNRLPRKTTERCNKINMKIRNSTRIVASESKFSTLGGSGQVEE